MKAKLSAIVLSYSRPKNIPFIVNELEKNDLIDEIIVWHSNPKIKLILPPNTKKTRLIKDSNKFGMHTRWYAAKIAKNQAVYMQDDDLLLSTEGLQQLFSFWQKDKRIIHGCFGRTTALSKKYSSDDFYGKTEIVLTRSLIFDKKYAFEMIKFLSKIPLKIKEITKRNGEDILFSYYVMSASGLDNVAHDLRRKITELESPKAISSRATHISERNTILDYCLKRLVLRRGLKESTLKFISTRIRILREKTIVLISKIGKKIKK